MQLQVREQDPIGQAKQGGEFYLILTYYGAHFIHFVHRIRAILVHPVNSFFSYLLFQRLVVCMEESLYIHNIRDMKVLHQVTWISRVFFRRYANCFSNPFVL